MPTFSLRKGSGHSEHPWGAELSFLGSLPRRDFVMFLQGGLGLEMDLITEQH